MKGSLNLTGHIIVSQPKGIESVFSKGVILVAKHNAEGAWGVMINKPTNRVNLGQVMKSTGISYNSNDPIYVGGPVDTHRIHVVHSLDWKSPNTITVTPDIGITSEMTVMAAIASNDGPNLYRVCVGLSGWTAGQLEGEYRGLPPWKPEHRWLDAPASIEAIFEAKEDDQWEKCISIVASTKVSDWL